MSDSQLMYKGISGATAATEIKPYERLKVAIVGLPKVGKSWLACTAPGQIYVADFDERSQSISGKPNVFVKTYKELNPKAPTMMSQLEQDIAMFEYNKTKGIPIPDTFVIDSMTYWVKAAESDLMYRSSSLLRNIKLGNTILNIPAGWDITTAIRSYADQMVNRLYALGNLICVFHEEPEKDRLKSKKDETVYTGKYAVHPYYLRTMLSTFNEVWRLEITQGNEYLLYVKSTNNFQASTTLKIDPTHKNPNIKEIIEKHIKATQIQNPVK